MKRIVRKIKELWAASIFESAETLKDELDTSAGDVQLMPGEIAHAEPGSFEAIKRSVLGHGEQTILPDDYEFRTTTCVSLRRECVPKVFPARTGKEAFRS
jgi:hypothetical protein